MKIERPALIRKPLPLTPLVDVVFLLLMFFMLTSSFTKFGNVGVDTAGQRNSAQQETPPQSARSPGVIIRVSRGPRLLVNGQVVELAGLPALLDSFQVNGVNAAALVTTADATVQDLVTVLETARRSLLKKIIVVKQAGL